MQNGLLLRLDALTQVLFTCGLRLIKKVLTQSFSSTECSFLRTSVELVSEQSNFLEPCSYSRIYLELVAPVTSRIDFLDILSCLSFQHYDAFLPVLDFWFRVLKSTDTQENWSADSNQNTVFRVMIPILKSNTDECKKFLTYFIRNFR